MNRPILAFALFAFASAAAVSAQQGSPATSPGPYQGTANPPADDTIEATVQQEAPAEAKPPAGKPMTAPAPVQQVQPRAVNPQSNTTDPNGGTDAGMVQGTQPAPTPERQPSLAKRSYADDPDGDIVHPDPLPPGVLGEGTTIRVRLTDGLSTVESQKGDSFRSTVASDVVENGQVLIPTGAQIEGHVVDVSSGHTGGHGSMRLRPETIIMADGSRFNLRAYVAAAPGARARMDKEGSIGADSRIKRDSIEYGGAVGTGAITGAVLGGPAGALAGTIIGASAVTIHLLVSHPQATLEPGTVLLFRLTQPLNLVSSNAAANAGAPVTQ
jgi:hypothetical protein